MSERELAVFVTFVELSSSIDSMRHFTMVTECKERIATFVKAPKNEAVLFVTVSKQAANLSFLFSQ